MRCLPVFQHPMREIFTINRSRRTALHLPCPQLIHWRRELSIDLRYLDQEPIILVAQEYTPRLFEVELLRACDDLGFVPRIVQRSPELMLALNLVATGMGVCFVPIDLLGLGSRTLCIGLRTVLALCY